MALHEKSYTYPYPRPSVTVDLVAFTLRRGMLQVLLVSRKNAPFKGKRAFPGGFLDLKESPTAGAIRETHEETGLNLAGPIYELGFYGDVDRDPRGRTISLVSVALIRAPAPDPIAGDDAASAEWCSLKDLKLTSLAFDHAKILQDAVDWLVYSPSDMLVLLRLLPEIFGLEDVKDLFRAFHMPVSRASAWCEMIEESCFAARLAGRKRRYQSSLVDVTTFERQNLTE